MGTSRGHKLNQLQRLLPEGLLADAAWFGMHGYSDSLRRKYVEHGWLHRLARGVYTRPGPPPRWQQVAVSLQTVLRFPVAVGGSTALDLQGFAHYLRVGAKSTIHLYSERPLPRWTRKLEGIDDNFVTHRATKLFPGSGIAEAVEQLPEASSPQESSLGRDLGHGLTLAASDRQRWPLLVSTPERAILETIDQLPARESFEHVDELMAGLATLSPKRLQELLETCDSIKVKRLFLWFAERHRHAWREHLDETRINIGSGKRMIVSGGHLDSKYLITVPKGFDADF